MLNTQLPHKLCANEESKNLQWVHVYAVQIEELSTCACGELNLGGFGDQVKSCRRTQNG